MTDQQGVEDAEMFEMLLRGALDLMKHGPLALPLALGMAAQLNAIELPDPLAALASQLQGDNPNNRLLLALETRFHEWDNAPRQPGRDTAPHTAERRAWIVEKLQLDATLAALVHARILMFKRDERDTVVDVKHSSWYDERKPKINPFYWNAYVRQLSAPGSGWSSTAVSKLANSTDSVMARLSDPRRADVYQVKGLVMGYVQSGKTAHFTGVIAKAVDAGYRVVIVMAGMLNLLRKQTQRRIDKSLVGQELLESESYKTDPDWRSFVSHGGLPSAKGSVDWERLTGREDDYSSLGTKLGALKFNKSRLNEAFNSADNLAGAPVRLIVIKKNPKMINALAEDLEKLKNKGTSLSEVPVLIIDDESDHASVNTLKPKSTEEPDDAEDKQRRTATNASIVRLLKVLPRAQYVGYTATPFANVFVDPLDAEQLFPKDFIISLPRPENYMGVADFFDFDTHPEGQGPNERRYVRVVKGADTEDQNLKRAIGSFILSGAIKLYRQSVDAQQFRFKHHTMLVHQAVTKAVHDQQAELIEKMWKEGSFTKGPGMTMLAALFDEDFRVHASETLPFPETFDALKPFIAQCIARVDTAKPVRIVNGDEVNLEDTPDFDAESIWAILVGGTKLSRGFTVEGLTTTYYRRTAGAGDTLMQMGRWFGFRPGYTDLVRWFVGTEQPLGKSTKTVNLYAQFGSLCRDEEAFRAELVRYVDIGDVTPARVAPLVQSHMPGFKPTATNKMYNAKLVFKNVGDQWKEKTAVTDKQADHNHQAAEALVARVGPEFRTLEFESDGKRQTVRAFCGIASNQQVLEFLNVYAWESGPGPLSYELEYLQGKHGDCGVSDWLVLLPQLKGTGSVAEGTVGALGTMTKVRRQRANSESSYPVFSAPMDRSIAMHVTGTKGCDEPNAALDSLRVPRRAVLVVYRVQAKDELPESAITIGLGIQFPKSNIPAVVGWKVEDTANADAIIVERKVPA